MNEFGERLLGIWSALPSSLKALIALSFGWACAALARFLVSGVLTLARMDVLAERTGFAEFLRKGNVRYSAAKLGGAIAYWLVLTMTLVGSAKILDVEIVSALGENLKEILPGLAAAIFVTLVGFIVVAFVSNFAKTIARNAAIPNAGLVARSIKYIGDFIVVLMALDQIGFGGSLLSTMALVLFAAIVFGFALAFGLGCKEMAGKAFEKFLRDLRERDRGSKGTDLEG